MIDAILCDQFGVQFEPGDIPQTKEYKKICSIVDNTVVIKLNEEKLTIFDGPTKDTKIVYSNTFDKNGKIKISDIFVVKNFC